MIPMLDIYLDRLRKKQRDTLWVQYSQPFTYYDIGILREVHSFHFDFVTFLPIRRSQGRLTHQR